MADKGPGTKSRKRKGRRARGTGSIFFHEGRGWWVGRKVVGTKPNGKPLQIERWGATQKEVVDKLAAAAAPGPDTTVAQWAARWRANWTVRPATQKNYAWALDDHLLPVLGHFKVSAVTPSQVEGLAAALRGKGLAPGSVLVALGAVRTMMMAAVREGLADRNPVSVARKPKAKPKKIDPFTGDELTRVMAAARHYAPGGVIAVLAGVGCRLGEALALDLDDYDPAAGTLGITKTFDRDHGLGPPKSEAGARVVKVPAVLRPLLAAAHADARPGGPLFPTRTGRRRNAQNVREAWGRVLDRAGLPYRNPHQLRHSVATAMVAAGEGLADVAAYLGDRLDTVVKFYVHPTGRSPVESLDRLFSN